jgi:hypothetical protein
MRKLYPKVKLVLQWVGSDIVWSTVAPHADAHVTTCGNWARETSEKFGVKCEDIHLTPLKVHLVTPMPSQPRILIYGHWDQNGGDKYMIPYIVRNIPPEVYQQAEIHVIGSRWRHLRVMNVQYHPWIEGEEEKERFWEQMSALIYMHRINEQHKYGGFIGLTAIEFMQMGRWVIRNGSYKHVVNAMLGTFQEAVTWVTKSAHSLYDEGSQYYSREFSPELCQNRLKEVLSALE